MGKIDTLTKDYISNNAVFADAYNYYVYDGKRVIQPEQLKDLDPTQITVPYGANGEMLPVQKFRDKMKGWT